MIDRGMHIELHIFFLLNILLKIVLEVHIWYNDMQYQHQDYGVGDGILFECITLIDQL